MHLPLQESIKGDYFEGVAPTLALFEKRLGDNDWFVGNKVCLL